MNDLRKVPLYTVSEASRYLRIPVSTLRSWVAGRFYSVSEGQRRRFVPIILRPQDQTLLSFANLIEAHLVEAIRKNHNIPLRKIRVAQSFLEDTEDISLAEADLLTDGVEIYVKKMEHILSASEMGQVIITDVLNRFLDRIETKGKVPIRFFPITRLGIEESPRRIVMDPTIDFGKPVVNGTRVGTRIIFERYLAGDGIRMLSQDYSLDTEDVEEAIRCEQAAA